MAFHLFDSPYFSIFDYIYISIFDFLYILSHSVIVLLFLFLIVLDSLCIEDQPKWKPKIFSGLFGSFILSLGKCAIF